MTAVREAYLDLLPHARHLLASSEAGALWAQPSSLPGYSVAGLAGHLVRGIRSVESALRTPAPPGGECLGPAGYWDVVLDADNGSAHNRGLRDRGEKLGSQGQDAVVVELDRLVGSLTEGFAEEPDDRLITVIDSVSMLLDDYLVTRIVEGAVHADDLASSVGLDLVLPDEASAIAIRNLVDVARRRHGNLAVLRALSRRERQAPDILCVF